MLASYLDKPTDQITIDSVNDARGGVRPFLESRKYAENSIRTYVNHVRILLNLACGNSDGSLTSHFRRNGAQCWCLPKGERCDDLAQAYLARIRKKPKDVTIEDLDQWTQIRCEQGLSYAYAIAQEDVVLAASSRLPAARNKLRYAFCERSTSVCLSNNFRRV
jgi:hypothetical protein